MVGFPIPSECSVVNTWIDVHLSWLQGLTMLTGVFYGFDGYLFPVSDPDAGDGINVLWDTHVPKMDQDLSYELSDASDAAPRYEPGQELTESILGMSFSAPEQVFKRRRLMSYASHPMGFDNTGPTWLPGEHFSSHIGKRYHAIQESALLFAASNPAMNEDVQNIELLPTGVDEEWAMMKYIDRVVEDMMVHVLGLGTVGSGTVPWSIAETFIENLVSDFATVANTPWQSTPNTFQCHMKATCQVVVPGKLPVGTLHAE